MTPEQIRPHIVLCTFDAFFAVKINIVGPIRATC